MKKRGKWILGIAVLTWVVILFVTLTSETDQQKADKAKREADKPVLVGLSATVSFDGSKFTITNLNNFNWLNVELEVNAALLKSGYKLKAGTMAANTTYTVGSLQFAKPDGTRLNTLAVKPQSFGIQCDISKGKSGYYTATW